MKNVKRKRSNLNLWPILMFFIVNTSLHIVCSQFLRIIPSQGYSKPIVAISIIVAVVYYLIEEKRSSYAISLATDAMLENRLMNNAESIELYFEYREKMISGLTEIAKKRLYGKSRLDKSPALILKELQENKPLSELACLQRVEHKAKEEVKAGNKDSVSYVKSQILNSKSKLEPQNIPIAESIIQRLSAAETIAETIEEVDHMEGHTFEYWCADLLRKNGFTNVEVTQGSGDQGVDVLAQKDGIKYAIQCKCYASDLGNTPIQEVHAGKAFYNCQVGVVMTNRHFTKGAQELADKTGTLLWDRDRLAQLLQNEQ